MINIGGIIVALINSVIVVHLFGTSRDIEIYFATNVFIGTLMKLSQGGVMSEILLPIYLDQKQNGKTFQEYKVVSAVVNWYVIMLLLLSFLLYYTYPIISNIIMPGFSMLDQQLSVSMFRLLLPSVPLVFVSGQIQTILNADKKYGRPEMIAIMSRIISLFIIVAFYRFIGIWVMPIALLTSSVIKFIALCILYFRNHGKFFLIFKVANISILPIVKNMMFTYPYIISTQLYTIIFNSALTMLPQGTLAVFNHSRNLIMRIEGVLLRPVSVVFFTQYAEKTTRRDNSTRKIVKKTTELLMSVLFPGFLIIIVSGDQFLATIWLNEEFTMEAVSKAKMFIAIMFIGLFAKSLNVIARKINITLGHMRMMYSIHTVVQILSALLVLYLAQYYGVTGIIVALLLNMILIACGSFCVLFIKNREETFFYNIESLYKWLLTIIITYGIMVLVEYDNIVLVKYGMSRYTIFAQSIFTTLISLLLCFTIAYSLNVKDVRLYYDRFSKYIWK